MQMLQLTKTSAASDSANDATVKLQHRQRRIPNVRASVLVDDSDVPYCFPLPALSEMQSGIRRLGECLSTAATQHFADLCGTLLVATTFVKACVVAATLAGVVGEAIQVSQSLVEQGRQELHGHVNMTQYSTKCDMVQYWFMLTCPCSPCLILFGRL